MSEPEVADKRPAVLELEPGTYHWCANGGKPRVKRPAAVVQQHSLIKAVPAFVGPEVSGVATV